MAETILETEKDPVPVSLTSSLRDSFSHGDRGRAAGQRRTPNVDMLPGMSLHTPSMPPSMPPSMRRSTATLLAEGASKESEERRSWLTPRSHPASSAAGESAAAGRLETLERLVLLQMLLTTTELDRWAPTITALLRGGDDIDIVLRCFMQVRGTHARQNAHAHAPFAPSPLDRAHWQRPKAHARLSPPVGRVAAFGEPRPGRPKAHHDRP